MRTQENAEMHGFAHECDAVFPSFGISRDGSHTALKLMANVAIKENQIFPFCGWEELLRLRLGNLIPVHDTLLQREIERGVLIGGESHSVTRIRAVGNCLYLYAIISGG